MTQTIEDAVAEAVDRIARFDDLVSLSHSPFHLNGCGGCGAPAFQQPCPLCDWYPRHTFGGGVDRRPEPATFEAFERMVLSTGPGSENGTVATWHASVRLRRRAGERPSAKAEAIIRDAASIDVPDARAFWDVARSRTVYREELDGVAKAAWAGITDMRHMASGDYTGIDENPRLAMRLTELLKDLIPAIHEDDRDAIVRIASDAGDAIRGAKPSGNRTQALAKIADLVEKYAASAAPTI